MVAAQDSASRGDSSARDRWFWQAWPTALAALAGVVTVGAALRLHRLSDVPWDQVERITVRIGAPGNDFLI